MMRDIPVDGDDERIQSDAMPLEVERTISYLRAVVMVSGTALLPMIDDRPGVIPWLAYLLLGLGWIYTIGVIAFEPYRRFPLLRAAWFTVASDLAITLLWIGATGGVDSPWSVAMYVAVASASLRMRTRDTLLVTAAAALSYIAMLGAIGQLGVQPTHTLVVCLYLVLLATVCAVIARARLQRLASRLGILDLTQHVALVGSWEWNITDGTIEWSHELKRIFGLAADATVTLPMYFDAIHPDDREKVQRTIDTAVAERAPMRFEHRIITTSGQVRWLHCRGRLVLDEAGSPRRGFGSSQDVTEMREIQEQLLVGRKLASLGTLASGIAHEINNPLAYVATSLELARRRADSGALDPESRRAVGAALEAAQDGCRRVAEIVRGLKIFARADDDGTMPVDLAAVADSALAIASHEIARRGKLVRDYHPAPLVVGTESRLLQVVLNLVVNAAHAIEDVSHTDHEVRIRIEPTGDGRVLLAVSDTGTGVALEHLPRIFDPFFTTKAPGVGMGLGLAICHGIVRELDGEIRVDTERGRGSTFTVLLPAAKQGPDGHLRTPHVEPLPRRIRVLLIDDEKIYANAMTALLDGRHDVTIAYDGGRALSLLCEGETFDVILCDLMMAGITGMDLYDAIAEIQPALVPRIVFLTGGATTDRARAFLQRPEIRHLEKPVELATLERTIRTIVEPAASLPC